MVRFSWKAFCATVIFLSLASQSSGGQLLVGAASRDITPEKPAALAGQFHLRLFTAVEAPLTVNAVVLESREGDQSLDQALVVLERCRQADRFPLVRHQVTMCQTP